MRRIITHRPRVTALSALLLLVASALSCAPEPTPRPRGEGPSLILLVVIDQGRAEYLERYRPLLDGGLGRLLDAGVRFTEARHGHAETTTAPGHASIASGRHPSRSGVVGNYWFLWPGYLDEATLERRGLSVEQVAGELAAGLETCPGVQPGRVDDVVYTVDIAPTLAALGGCRCPRGWTASIVPGCYRQAGSGRGSGGRSGADSARGRPGLTPGPSRCSSAVATCTGSGRSCRRPAPRRPCRWRFGSPPPWCCRRRGDIRYDRCR